MFKQLVIATLIGATILSACDKQKEIEREEFSMTKSLEGAMLSEEIIKSYPFLQEVKPTKALVNTFSFEGYPSAKVGAKYRHGACGNDKGLCSMDTLYPGVPSFPELSTASLAAPLPTADTLYPGHIYLLADNKVAYFPSDYMYLSNKTLPISDTMIAAVPIATALGKSNLTILPGLYPMYSNFAVNAFGTKGYVILDCITY